MATAWNWVFTVPVEETGTAVAVAGTLARAPEGPWRRRKPCWTERENLRQ
jgi:hypothetical protein